MKINPKSLRRLRDKQGLTRPQLAERSGINKRTIQRLENEPQQCQKSRKDTLERLAKALGVKPGVLTGELPPPEFDKVPDPDRVQIGAQVAPKVRLAYDLIKTRYGVSAAEIINMAPLFFALLAEGCLAWRREKLKELKEGIDRLEQIEGFWHGHQGLPFAVTPVPEAIEAEEDSITKADLFGEHLLDCMTYDLDPSTDNPFASYLRKLRDEFPITGVVDVDSDDLRFGSPLKFPDYNVCLDELDRIANGSTDAKRALEIGPARLSEIPEELMAEEAGEERAKWLEDRLSDILKDLKQEIKDLEQEIKDLDEKIKDIGAEIPKNPEDVPKKLGKIEELFSKREELLKKLFRKNRHAEEMAHSASLSGTYPEGDSKKRIDEADSQTTNSNIGNGGDDQ